MLNASYASNDLDEIANADSLPAMYADIENTNFGKAKKAVLELHAYKQSDYYMDHLEDCAAIQGGLYRFGFNALGESGSPRRMQQLNRLLRPLQLSSCQNHPPHPPHRVGDAQDSGFGNLTMQKCMRDFTIKNKIGWAHWALAGSYRIRQGVQFNNGRGD